MLPFDRDRPAHRVRRSQEARLKDVHYIRNQSKNQQTKPAGTRPRQGRRYPETLDVKFARPVCIGEGNRMLMRATGMVVERLSIENAKVLLVNHFPFVDDEHSSMKTKMMGQDTHEYVKANLPGKPP
jgi:hypothetical protein